MTKQELRKQIIENVYQRSKDFNGDENINYAYSCGAFEIIIETLLDYVPEEKLEQIKSETILIQ